MKCIVDAWDAYQRELLRFISSRVADTQEANDLVQECRRAFKFDHLCALNFDQV